MTPEQQKRVDELFLAAADLPVGQREAFLAEACPDDATVREEVESLLGHEHGAGFLESQSGSVGLRLPDILADAGRATDDPPESIGRYRVLEKIGQGGMATVYAAEQDNPRRVVALKVLHAGPANRSLAARFQREIRVLSQLVHPGIGQIYDAGVEPSPRGAISYFAMELVRGPSLLAYADERNLGSRARLELVAEVCDAIQFAHEQGVIHRDLKPSNILVDQGGGEPRVKVLDFGVARVTSSDLQLTRYETNAVQLVGTVPYMSPEQVHGRSADLDERTDVYSLGVVLYELLAGRLPLDVQNCSIPEAMRIIQEEEPTRLSSIRAELRGDVETIVSKALDKERDRRYASAAALAADIRRFLHDQPIDARPTSTFYQFRKFAKRNKTLVGVVVFAFAGLAVATIVTARMAVGEAAQRQLAEWRTNVANLVAAQMALRAADAVTAQQFMQRTPQRYRDLWEWRLLARQMDQSAALLRGHTDRITDLEFSPDDARLLSASQDGTIRVWDIATRRPLRVLGERGMAAQSAAFSPDGCRIASVSDDGTIQIRDALSGQTLLSHVEAWSLTSVAFSPDNRRLLYSEERRVITELDLLTGSQISSRSQPDAAQRFSRFVRGGAEIVGATTRGYSVLDPGSFERILDRSAPHERAITCLGASSDGSVVTTGSLDNSLFVWHENAPSPSFRLIGHRAGVSAVAVDPAGMCIASGSFDHTIRLWDAMTGATKSVLLGHSDTISSVAFSHDGAWVASGDFVGAIRIWERDRDYRSESTRILRGHTSFVYAAAFDPSDPTGGRLVSASWDGTVRVWNTETGETTQLLESGQPRLTHVAISTDGSTVAAGNFRSVILWDLHSGARVRMFTVPRPGALRSLLFDGPDRLVATSALGTYVCWDIASGDEIGAPVALAGECIAVMISGKPCVARFGGTNAQILDAGTGRVLLEFDADGEVSSFDITRDGRRFVTTHADGTAIVWDGSTGARLGALVGHKVAVFDAVFAPDGTRISTGSDDNTVRIWSAETFEQLLELRGHTRYVHGLAFSEDGRRLASASGDGTIRLWFTSEVDRAAPKQAVFRP